MSTERRYAIPVEQVEWPIPGAFDTVFRWEYEDARDALVRLYEKAKNLQWDTITPTLKRLLNDVLSDSRWDMTYLGMQVLIEGLALAAFATIRDQAKNRLAAAVNAYVMQDEARHVAFGRLALRDYYPQLTQAERDEREEFAVEACYLMRDRFLSEEVWETLGLPVEECVAYVERSEMMRRFRSTLFSRIVPTIKDIGLWGPKIRRAYANMGIMGYAEVDTEELTRNDERVAEEFDRRRPAS